MDHLQYVASCAQSIALSNADDRRLPLPVIVDRLILEYSGTSRLHVRTAYEARLIDASVLLDRQRKLTRRTIARKWHRSTEWVKTSEERALRRLRREEGTAFATRSEGFTQLYNALRSVVLID